MIRKILKSIKKAEAEKETCLYHTLVGSIVTSIGIIKGNNEYQNYKVFKEMRRKTFKEDVTVRLLAEEVAKLMKVDLEKLNGLVLVYDEKGVLGPMVTLEFENRILPLKPNAEYTGILFALWRNSDYAKEHIKVEEIFRNAGPILKS